MRAIFLKELWGYLNSLVAYLVIVLFLILLGLVVWVFPSTNLLDYGYADLTGFFKLSPFVLLFLIPAVTMRSFSEEYKTGTLELLLSKPLSLNQVVLGKFFAAFCLIILALIPTLVYYFLLHKLAVPEGNIDAAAVMGSYFGLFMLAGILVALGILCSSFSDNQIVSFLLACSISYFWFDGLHQIAEIWKGGKAWWIDFFSLNFQYESFSRGLIDSRNLLFMITSIVLLLLLTSVVIKKKIQ